MAKATMVLPNGTKVHIEGTADEVASLLAMYSGEGGAAAKASPVQKAARSASSRAKTTKTSKRTGPVGLITELAQGGFFKTRRRLPEIQSKLEENGHIYAQTSLSPAVLALTKKKVLRRLKEQKGWAYVAGAAHIS